MTDYLSLDATEQLVALSTKQISARELLDLSVQHADSLNPRLNTIVVRDMRRAAAEAQAIDDRRARGESLGPLAGLPMTVKDHFDIDGFPSSFGGDASLLQRKEVKDAGVIRKVRATGAIIWGRTNLSIYGGDVQAYNKLYGTTNNPWDVTRTSGGSSGGAAVAVATGMTALEIGSDIGGSLRTPASFCGIFAHKPTYGLVSQEGFAPARERIVADMDLAVIGPMARSVRDLRLLLSIMTTGVPAPVAHAKLQGIKAAVWLNEPDFTLDAETRAPLAVLAERLAAAGANVEPVACPVLARQMMFAYTMLLYAVSGANLPWSVRAFYEALRPPSKLALAFGAKPLSWAQGVVGLTARHSEWLIANEARARMSEVVQGFFGRFDVLIAPVCPVAAFPHDHRPIQWRNLKCSDGRSISYLEMIDWVALATLLGLPATVVPAGFTKMGLPVGVQIIGPRNGDALTLSIAQAIEEQIGGFHWPPLFHEVAGNLVEGNRTWPAGH